MSFSFFKPTPLDQFDFHYIDHLFVENRLLNWIGEKKSNGQTFNSLKDFFQPNYIETQIKAFFWGLDTVPDELNFTWISRLHHAASHNLKHEWGKPISHNVRRAKTSLTFPSPLSQMMGSSSKASPEGILELGKNISDSEDEETKGKVVFFIEEIKLINNTPSLVKEITIDAETASKYYEEQIKLFAENIKFFENLKKETKINSASQFAELKKDPEKDPTLLEPMMKIINAGFSSSLKNVGYSLLNRNPLVIRKKAERMIQQYNKSSKINETEKLDAIIILIKGLLNLHLYQDGNGRLNAHQLLNILLIKNGLTPSLLKNNCLDAFTHTELRERIIQGMVLFKEKCTEKIGSLKHYREVNQLPKAKESEFTNAIINNQLEQAKNICTHEEFLLDDRLDVFTSCLAARMDWLPSEVTDPDILELIIDSCIYNANYELLRDLLIYCNDKKIVLNDSSFEDVLMVANTELFDLLKKLLITTNHDETFKLLSIIPNMKDPDASLKAIDYALSKNSASSELDEKFMVTLFTRQQPDVILYLMNNKEIQSFYQQQDNNFSLTNKLNNIIKNREDLSFDEKNKLLSKDAKLIYVNPLNDFPKKSPKVF